MRFFWVIVFVFFSSSNYAQDTHYSLFESTTSLLNPSLISHQKNDYQIELQRRSQWFVIPKPFNTFSVSFNAKNIYKKISLGTTILNDVSGDSYFSTDGLALHISYLILKNNNNISVSLQAGSYQRSINYESLIFLEDEISGNNKKSFFDIGVSASNKIVLNEISTFLLGLSFYHLNTPDQSFYSKEKVFLDKKYVLYLKYQKEINQKTAIMPSAYFSSQNQQKEFLIGGKYKYKINKFVDLDLGLYRRIEDAFIITLGLTKNNLQAQISYDINTSSLATASNSIGAFEFAISYGWNIFRTEEKDNIEICPKYL